jgi:hypothetical protein
MCIPIYNRVSNCVVVMGRSDSDEHQHYELDNDSDSVGDSDSESDGDSAGESIFDQDQDHIDTDKENGRYYIGMQCYIEQRNLMLVANTVSVSTFYKYSGKQISDYLYSYSVIRPSCEAIDIIKLHILPDDSYSVVLKTHWLRVVQRTWKKVYQERKRILINRMVSKNRQYYEIHGQYPCGMNVLPSLNGMLISIA